MHGQDIAALSTAHVERSCLGIAVQGLREPVLVHSPRVDHLRVDCITWPDGQNRAISAEKRL